MDKTLNRRRGPSQGLKKFLKSWTAKGPGRRHFQNDSCSKMALNVCKAIESRWKRNCASLSSVETDVIPWPCG